jgi:hypothetical protein
MGPKQRISLHAEEKQWLFDSARSGLQTYHNSNGKALQAILSSGQGIRTVVKDAQDAQLARVRPGKIKEWLQWKAGRLSELEADIASGNAHRWCTKQMELLVRQRRDKTRSVRYPAGEKARIGRAGVHEKGALPAVPRAQVNQAAIAESQVAPPLSTAPSFQSFERLVFATEEMFGWSAEKRDLWRDATLTAAVGSRARVVDRASLRALFARSRPSTLAEVRGYLEAPPIGCFTVGGGNGLLILRPEEGGVREYRASAHVLASIMGVPLELCHPARKGIAAVSDPQGRMLLGQAVDVDVMEYIYRYWLPDLVGARSRKALTYGDMFSGLSLGAAAAMQLRPSARKRVRVDRGAQRLGQGGPGRFRYKVAVEALSDVLVAHQAAWGDVVECVVQYAQSSEAGEAMRAAAPLDISAAGVRCAPWSQAKTTVDPNDPNFEQLRERTLEENCESINNMVAASPRLIVLETSEYLLKGQRKPFWRRMSAHLLSFPEYTWCYQVICPRKHFGKWVPRQRLYIMGLRTEGI